MLWRRKFPRLSTDFQITYRTITREKFANDPISSLALNISGGGLCFEAVDHLPKGVMVALDIHSDDFSAPLLALAQVVWCKPYRTMYRVGAEFWWVGWGDNQAQTAIANYVTSQTTMAHMATLG